MVNSLSSFLSMLCLDRKPSLYCSRHVEFNTGTRLLTFGLRESDERDSFCAEFCDDVTLSV